MNSPPRQNVFPQWFPSRMLFQNYFDPLSRNYFVGGSTCQASTTSVLHPPFHSNSTFKTCFEIWGMPSENAPSTCIRNLRITEGYPDTPIKKSSDKRKCVALRCLPKQNWKKHKVNYQEILHNVGFAKAFYYYLGMSCCFLRSMRCKSGSANKFKHHVSWVLPPSHPRISLQFKLHQERIKVCNPQPKNVLWEMILGVLERPRTLQKSKWAAARTIQLEAGNKLKNI